MALYPKCPFYEFEEKTSLHCEGATLDFPDKKNRGEWMKLHCCSWDFKICKFYCSQLKKYES